MTSRELDSRQRSLRIPVSGLHVVHRLVQERPDDIIPLHVGEPGVTMSPRTRDAFIRALTDGRTEYCDAPGLYELREPLVDKLRTRNGIDTDIERVFVTPGSCEGISAVMQSLAFDGGVVLLPEVHWPTHLQQVINAGMRPRFYAAASDTEALVAALESGWDSKTCAVVINSPANPSGQVLDWSTLCALHEWARSRSVWVISDEAYEDFVYRGNGQCVGSLDNHLPEADRIVFSTYSFSKGASMSGARLGYVVAPNDERATLLRRVQEAVLIAPSTPTQLAGIAALDDQEHLRQHHCYLAENRDAVVCALDAETFFGQPPAGGWYALLRLCTDALNGEQQPWRTVLRAIAVAVAPGEVFLPPGHDVAPTLIRISLCGDRTRMLEGLRRLRPLLRGGPS